MKRMIVAEDEPETRNDLEMALRCQGYSVDVAQDEEEVLRLLDGLNGQAGAVLLDAIAPRKNTGSKPSWRFALATVTCR